jgi:hypothetical protein
VTTVKIVILGHLTDVVRTADGVMICVIVIVLNGTLNIGFY